MRDNEYKVLVGATDAQELIFAEVRFGKDYFAVSYDTVSPINLSEFDKEEYCSDLYDRDSLGDEEFLNLLERYDCSPSELPKCIANDWDISDILDLSLYPEEIEVDGDTYVFESIGCGQSDDYKNVNAFLGKEASDTIFNAWKEFHLKPIPQDKSEEVHKAIESLYNWDEEDWIRGYIETMREKDKINA